ncbi:MAG: citryl-CoA lyase [Candidatus Zixiibacteriota bacterium]|nr:MAG: citryl-CoA lyase [candidate division Zixibacteria bacterium]
MGDQQWHSSITEIGPGKIRVRGYHITDIMEKLNFAEAVFLILKGELPNRAESEMMRAILVSSIDHGCSPPSVLGARNVIAGGNPLNAAIAGGVLVIGDSHGGAIENAAKIMQRWAKKEGAIKKLADDLVDYILENKIRMPGFGHRLHNVDPRTIKLFEIAKRCGFSGRHIELCIAIEKALEEKLGRKLPINVDGGIAAVISDMGFDWRLGKGFFIISRVPGLVAQAYEEMTREKPMRELGNRNFSYDGPAEREIGKHSDPGDS